MRYRARIAAGLAVVAVLLGCQQIVGTRDLTFEPSPDAGGTSADSAAPPPGTDGATPPQEAGPLDAGAEAATCSGANLQTDPRNCGRCGHDCAAGACQGGVCQAFTLVPGQPGSAAIALDDTSVYWSSITTGQVLKANKDGTSPVALSTVAGSIPLGMTIDSDAVYWIDDRGDTALLRCPKTGCDGGGAALTPETLFYPSAVAVGEATAFFTEYETGSIGRIGKDGGALGFVVTGLGYAVGVAVDDASVFFTNGTTIGAVPPSKMSVASDTDDAGPYASLFLGANNAFGLLSSDDGNLYWAENSATGGAVKFIPKAGASVATVVASAETSPLHVAVDSQAIYWTAQGPDSSPPSADYYTFVDGYVAMCPKTGCPASGPVHLADGVHQPDQIAVDATAIYFTIIGNINDTITEPTEGSVMKVMK